MNVVLSSLDRTLLSLTRDELAAITNALNEVCNGVQIEDAEFEARIGVNRGELREILAALLAEPPAALRQVERTDVWSEHGAVMVRALNVYGDPVELSEASAQAFASDLKEAIEDAS